MLKSTNEYEPGRRSAICDHWNEKNRRAQQPKDLRTIMMPKAYARIGELMGNGKMNPNEIAMIIREEFKSEIEKIVAKGDPEFSIKFESMASDIIKRMSNKRKKGARASDTGEER